jgi:hypoxanthine phosphoribosyltransferase
MSQVSTMISAEQIQAKVRELGQRIKADYAGKKLVLVCVLKGSFVFTADLARAIEGPVNVEFLGVASYGMSTESSGAVKITQDLASPIEGKDVVLVEDIIDTGLTLAYLMQILAARRPKRLRIASLLEKPSGNSPVKADYTGFTVGREFVVGYGLDWGERFRNLPYVAKVEAASLDAPA